MMIVWSSTPRPTLPDRGSDRPIPIADLTYAVKEVVKGSRIEVSNKLQGSAVLSLILLPTKLQQQQQQQQLHELGATVPLAVGIEVSFHEARTAPAHVMFLVLLHIIKAAKSSDMLQGQML